MLVSKDFFILNPDVNMPIVINSIKQITVIDIKLVLNLLVICLTVKVLRLLKYAFSFFFNIDNNTDERPKKNPTVPIMPNKTDVINLGSVKSKLVTVAK